MSYDLLSKVNRHRYNLHCMCTIYSCTRLYELYQAIQKLSSAKDQNDAQRLLNELTDHQNVPLTHNDSVAFIFSGEAKTVSWTGDFNAWGYDKGFNGAGHRVPNTNVWILKASFPKDARFDYKIILNETQWIIDPLNPHQQWSGVGGGSPNSELRMPLWKEEPLSVPLNKIPHGRVEKDILINSKTLSYQVMYSIYTPPLYDAQKAYPVIYITDGYEYMHERMGNMVTILDNLIYLKKMKETVAVFIDHREPVDRSHNRRMHELAMDEKYLAFVADELVPTIEKKYTVSTDPSERAILGASMGGLAAAYFAFSKPDIFGLAGIQSPSFWFRNEIYKHCDNPDRQPVKIFLTTGMINDSEEGAIKMKDILDKNTCHYQYREVNQGHSWGNWRDLIDDILIYFFGT